MVLEFMRLHIWPGENDWEWSRKAGAGVDKGIFNKLGMA